MKHNPSKEQFARLWFSGASGVEAARAVGYKGDAKALERTATRLRKDAGVLALYQELAAIANKSAVFTRDEALQHLARVMRFDFGDVIDETGAIDLKKVEKYRATGIISRIKKRFNQWGDSLEVEFASKEAALERLCQLNGWVVHRVEEVRKDVTQMTDTELEAAVEEYAKGKKGGG